MAELCEGRVCIDHRCRARHRPRARADAGGARRQGRGQRPRRRRWTATGARAGPAHDVVVDEIEAMGGEAVANGDDISDWDGAEQLVAAGHRHLRRPRRAHQQRRHPARPHAHQHDRGRVGRGHQGAPEGHRSAPSHYAAAYWRERSKAGETNDGRIINTTRRRASTATSARPTTARPRPASPPSRSSRPWSSAATASP